MLLHTVADVATKEITITQNKWFTIAHYIIFNEATKNEKKIFLEATKEIIECTHQ